MRLLLWCLQHHRHRVVISGIQVEWVVELRRRLKADRLQVTFSFIEVFVSMKVIVLLRIYHQHGPMMGVHYRAIGFDVLREMAQGHESGVTTPHRP